ncbi:MAG: hypothetical protein QOE70_1664 [Chthoniobacter sp.]|jgi:hypothetical protein|nr:hypothetical protein [Chthoniobacter sp.]
MIQTLKLLLISSAFGLLAGCATQPLVIDAAHPASAAAPEAVASAARSNLAPDTDTRRTRELLARRELQAKAAEDEAPADQTQINPSAPKPATPPASTSAPKNEKARP